MQWVPDQRVMVLRLKQNTDLGKWLEKWQHNKDIQYLHPNSTVRISQAPNDRYYAKQTYLQRIHADQAWDKSPNSDVTVAILDTGVDLEQPDLRANLVEGINLLDKNASPQDDNGHGTNVAGIVAATSNNSIGVTGIAPHAKIMPVKVLDKKGEGDSFLVGQGIRYAVDHGAKVILLSLGEPVYTPFMKEAVDYAELKNVLIVAASGNEGNQLNYPAAFADVLSVGAIDSNDQYASYSNYGEQLDVVAPGDGIFTTGLNGEYVTNSGTSMAAPQAAGLAALLYQKYPKMTPEEIRDIIKFSADDVDQKGWDERTGYGKIDVQNALKFPLEGLQDGYEPNNQKETATMFPSNDTFRGQLTLNQDIDWFKLELPYHGVVEFQVNIQQDLKTPMQVTIHNEETGENYIYKVKESTKISLDLKQGTSYIQLEYSNKEKIENQPIVIDYTLTNQFRINQDKYENNDNLWQAYKIQNVTQPINGTFHKEHDWDWYQIQVNQTGELTVKVTVDTQRLDPILWFQPKGKKNIEVDNNGSGKEETKTFSVTPGTYYIKLADYNGYEVIGEYQLYIQLKTPDGDTHEPNDLPYEATPIEGNYLTTAGVILDQKDQDWYKVNIEESTDVGVKISNSQNQSIEAALYNTSLDVIWTSETPLINQTHKLAPGTYYIRVRGSASRVQYSLTFSEKQMPNQQPINKDLKM
ncbi:S8 family peptidase [Tepidibacillus marianensis]|uniref:S8 family peptidase n=1 Tax=Tepidibacillus marianensis TaxID=3131995 RepID=UPI0030CB0D88